MEATHTRLRAGFERLEARVGACAVPGGNPNPKTTPARALQLEPSAASPEALPGADEAGGGTNPGLGPGSRLGPGFTASSAGEAAVRGGQRPAAPEAAFPGFAVPAGRDFETLEGAARSGLGSPARRSVGSPASAARSPTGKGTSSPAALLNFAYVVGGCVTDEAMHSTALSYLMLPEKASAAETFALGGLQDIAPAQALGASESNRLPIM